MGVEAQASWGGRVSFRLPGSLPLYEKDQEPKIFKVAERATMRPMWISGFRPSPLT